MNLRGVKESVTAIAPIFGVFLVTHAILLLVAIGSHVPRASGRRGGRARERGRNAVGAGAVRDAELLMRAYSLGGGTYTGIEAVSNGIGIMREPRVQTAKRTMLLMAISLAITASGLLVALPALARRVPSTGKTMNAVLLERVAGDWSLGGSPSGRRSSSSRWSAKGRCCSSRRRRASSTARA